MYRTGVNLSSWRIWKYASHGNQTADRSSCWIQVTLILAILFTSMSSWQESDGKFGPLRTVKHFIIIIIFFKPRVPDKTDCYSWRNTAIGIVFVFPSKYALGCNILQLIRVSFYNFTKSTIITRYKLDNFKMKLKIRETEYMYWFLDDKERIEHLPS